MLTAGEPARDPRARRAAGGAEQAGIEVVRLGGRSAAGGAGTGSRLPRELRGLGRVARLASLTARLVWEGRRLGPLDVVHAHDLNTLPAAFMIARRARARLVYDVHELYAEQEPDPPWLHRRLVRLIERRFAPRADAVVTVSDPIAAELRRTLRLRAQPYVVLSAPPRTGVEPAPRGAGPLRAVYQGAMGPGRKLTDLLEAAELTNEVHLTIRVVGAHLAALRQEIALRRLGDRVEVVEPVDPRALVEALQPFHVGLVINRPLTRNDELVLPNKLFEYLMAGLAVVVPRLPGLAPLVELEQVGLTYEPGDPHDLARVLDGLAADERMLADLRGRARAAALERYNAEEQLAALIQAWGSDRR
jgi:glycogen synthase